ncbi:MAG: hypothetical protein ACJ8AO_12690, partial [Gemmatimonadaceae bacterium]
ARVTGARAAHGGLAALGAALGAALLLSTPAAAQERASGRTPLGWEVRADGIFAAHEQVAQLGAGVSRALGSYARLTLVAAAGAADAEAAVHPAVRADGFVRITTDPFAEHARAPYVGAGVSARGRPDADPRVDLLVVLGVDGRPRGAWAPAFELGLGGGARVGLVLRHLRAGQR